MTSERQKAANRANARHSTGPNTPEGKAAVRLNACRHGLLARDVVLPGEDPAAFEQLRNQIREDFLPVGPIEEFLVERLVDLMWRVRRCVRAETALFHSRINELQANRLKKEAESYEESFVARMVIPPDITNKAAHAQAKKARERALYEQNRDEVLIGRAIDADAKEGDAFPKLARYERGWERSLHRTLDQLREEQQKRRKRSSSPISADAGFLPATE